jgi:hypothetical protein
MAKDPLKKTAVTDPLEAAKIVSKPIVPPPPPPDAPPELAAPTGDVEPTRAPPKKYRVVEDTKLSLHGQMIHLHKDDIVSEASYGPRGMHVLLNHEKLALVEHKE